MKQFSKDLGNVSLAPKGKWSREQEYERLALVYNACDNLSYVAKIDVPSGVDIENREYWQPMNATGYADNNFINLTAENENGTITAYESLEEAVATILPINRRAGATLSFYNLNSDRLDRKAEFELWQFNSTDLANWENKDYWNNIYYNWNVFVGWYIGDDALKNHVKIPNVGQYAYVGSNLNDTVLYQCRTNGTWTNTGIKVRNYISVVVSGNITIGENGNWFNGGKDTGIPATPAVDEQLDNIIIQLQQHATEIDKLQKQDIVLKNNIDSNFETINNKVDNIKTATDNKIDTADANLQNQITSNDTDIATLNTKHESLSRTVQGIAATGGASTATNVTYNNDNSGLNAENTQDAIDEISSVIIYDVSARNNGAVFESLQGLLSSSNLNTLIPTSVRRGGMTIRFIQGSVPNPNNKYVQYRLANQSWSIDVNDWEDISSAEFSTGEKVSEVGIDDEPTVNSKNLINSGSVATIQKGNLKKEYETTTIDLNIDDFALLDHSIATISDGYIKLGVNYKIYYFQIDTDCLIKYKLGASFIAGNAALFICNSQPDRNVAFINPVERVAYSTGSFNIQRGQYLCVQGYSTSATYLPSLLKKEVKLFENINIFDELGEKRLDSIKATNVWSAIEEVNNNIPQVNTTALSIKPLMVDTASFFWTHKQATNFNQNNPFKISGIANSNTLNVLSGGQNTSVLTSADSLSSIVVKFDDGTCKPYMLIGWSTDTLIIYPSIDTAITDGEVVPLMLDSQHLTNYGYNAYSQHLFTENPRYCEKNKFIERYGSTKVSPFTLLPGTPAEYKGRRNDSYIYSCQYGDSGIFMIPYTDYSTVSEYGYQWEVSTKGIKGYLETYIGTCNGFYLANTFTLDTGYEIHIECWIDGVKAYEKIKDNIFIERICVPYAKNDDKVKLKVYLTQIRSQKDTLYIGPTTFWVNEIERNNLIDKHEVVAQLFDSWGVFGAADDYIEDEDGNKWYQGQSGKELHRLINEDNGFILPYYNYSVGGMTTRWGKVWWYHNVWTFHPDVMITDFGINDYHTNMAQFSDFNDPYGNTISMATAVTATEFYQNMETLFDMCIRHNIIPIYVMCSRVGCDIGYINTFISNHAQQLSLS